MIKMVNLQMKKISKVGNPDTAVEIIRLALLASYNENRKVTQSITNEDAPPIWLDRAKGVLRDIEKTYDAKPKDELRALLIKTFAQTVEYGAMCSECCSSQGDGAKVLCEMSDKPLQPDDYCPQQIACIEGVLPQIIANIFHTLPNLEKELKTE